ncbi:peptidase S8/S53 domain-containing protein [Podospora aff. communis PSN243]|uniref:Peptidase S8/S53 domain-containing protein n=1 Tax=Podospora aff. communis PSN243 TaxID=3040156 RepID=A0AAV9G549_9PEZI|nr:peptidase S8/S53 domain-containing protein [Podospora aff. communis PSN243]
MLGHGFTLSLLGVLGLVAPAVATARGEDSLGAVASSATVIPRSFMVEIADGHDVESFYSGLRARGIQASPKLNITYSLFKGASFELKTDDAETKASIAELPAVKNFWPVRSLQVHNPSADDTAESWINLHKRQLANNTSPFTNHTEPTSFSPHVMAQVNRLHAKGITGKGIKVAIIDTGIDYRHPALGGCFGPGCLVSYGYDWFGLLGEDSDPFDECNGHGTHVAGIVAAQPNPLGFIGAAPGVTLGAYKALTCTGGGREDVLVAAFNKAFDDGSDIISFSGSLSYGWNQHPLSVTVQRIVEKGVPCIASAGNTGADGLFTFGSPGAGKGVASVANIINAETPSIHTTASYSMSGSSEPVPFTWNAGNPALPTLSLPLWALSNDLTVEDDACSPLPLDTPDLSKYVVLVRDSDFPPSSNVNCRIINKISHVVERGARYMIVYSINQHTKIIDATIPRYIVGIGMVSAAQGEEWVKLLNDGRNITLNLDSPTTAKQVIYSPKNTKNGGLMAPRSSWGLSWELDVKPQFGAPGQDILSTWRTAKGSYKIDSGTSMSAPLITAIYALLAEARKTTDPKTLENLLSATAKPTKWYDGTKVHDMLAPVPQQGAGLVQAYDAAFSTTLLNVSSLAFNDSDHFVGTTSFQITNLGTEDATYELDHVAAATVYASSGSYDPDPAAFELARSPPETPSGSPTLSLPPSIRVAAGSSAVVTVTATPPTGLDPGRLPIYSGFITLNSTAGESLVLPYAGAATSMRSLPVLSRNPEWTKIRPWNDPFSDALPENTTFTVPVPTGPPNQDLLPDLDLPLPCAMFTRNLGSAHLRMDIVPLEVEGELDTTEVLGIEIAGSAERYPLRWYPGRGATEDPFTGMLSDGRVVPEGRYRFVMRALRVFGDERRVEDWDVVWLPAFWLRYRE